MGTSWHDPPILDSPRRSATINGRQVPAFLQRRSPEAGRLEAPKRASYWISNTLLQTVTANEMLAVARSLSQVR